MYLIPYLCHCSICSLIDIFVRLQAVRYIVEEGNSMMVCAELVGRTEVTLEVNITTESSGLAEGIIMHD